MSLHTIAAIRTLAEERAREFYDHAFSDYDAEGFRKLRGKERARWILAFHKQLCDLTRPDSRDAVARLVAAKVGIECGATAPELRQVTVALPSETESIGWALLGAPGEQYLFFDRNVPGISAITDPADALRLIASKVIA